MSQFFNKNLANSEKNVILEQCKGMHCVDLGESFPTHIFLQNLASIQPRTSPVKFARSLAEPASPPGAISTEGMEDRKAVQDLVRNLGASFNRKFDEAGTGVPRRRPRIALALEVASMNLV